jgi:hypothetical protein
VSWAANLPMHAGLRRAYHCLLKLSAAGYAATRVRIQGESVMVEIDRPLDVAGDIQIKGGYAAIEFSGCSVAWKLSEES